MPLSAVVSAFRLEIASLPRSLVVQSFSGTDAINQPFSFTLEVCTDGPALDLHGLMYRPAFLACGAQGQGFHGQIQGATRSHYRPGPACYRLTLGPRLACLGLRNTARVFQRMSATQIISQVLGEHGLREGSYRFDLQAPLSERELCAQYQESDLQLLQRLCAEEGLHYYFCHSRQGHELVFGKGLRGFRRSPPAPWRKQPQAPGVTRMAVRFDGVPQVDDRTRQQAEGQSTLPFVASGYMLPLTGHPDPDWNHLWLLTSVEHRYSTGEGYSNGFQAVPWEVGFRVSAVPRVPMPALQRAWVVGGEGQVVKPDVAGRLPVQLSWGLQGHGARFADCWLPVRKGLGVTWRGLMEVVVGHDAAEPERLEIIAALYDESLKVDAEAGQVDRVEAQLGSHLLLNPDGELRLADGTRVNLASGGEVSVRIGASRLRLDANGLSLSSPRISFVARAPRPAAKGG